MRFSFVYLPADVYKERDRRLAAGFSYDFGDARGVHQFSTDDENMKGWNKVTSWATLQLILGNHLDWIEIDTDTGVTTVVPSEWVAIIQAMTTWQQQIYSTAPRLIALSPIPADFNQDHHWNE